MTNDPFQPPAVPIFVPRPPSGVVRAGAWLALAAEIGLPVLREGAVWAGFVTVDGTRWLGLGVVALQVLAASLVAWGAPHSVRVGIAALGVAGVVAVGSAYFGRIQPRFVRLASLGAVAGIELSQAFGAATALRAAGRSRMAALAWAAVVATATALVLRSSGLMPLVRMMPVVWIGGRLLRYVALVRLGVG